MDFVINIFFIHGSFVAAKGLYVTIVRTIRGLTIDGLALIKQLNLQKNPGGYMLARVHKNG